MRSRLRGYQVVHTAKRSQRAKRKTNKSHTYSLVGKEWIASGAFVRVCACVRVFVEGNEGEVTDVP